MTPFVAAMFLTMILLILFFLLWGYGAYSFVGTSIVDGADVNVVS